MITKRSAVISALSIVVAGGAMYYPFGGFSYSSGAPLEFGERGYTGSKGDFGKTCATVGCHAQNGTIDGLDLISTSLGQSPILAGDTIQFSIDRSKIPAAMEDDQNDFIGEFITIDTLRTQALAGGRYLTHTREGALSSSDFKFSWMATQDVGDNEHVYFHASINLSNADGTPSGDQIANAVISAAVSETSEWIKLFPNPAKDHITLRRTTELEQGAWLEIVSITGQQVFKTTDFNELEISLKGWMSGTYFVHLHSQGEIQSFKFVKQ